MKLRKILLLFLLPCLGYIGCSNQISNTSMSEKQLDIQGHRGCRGLLPENSIPAFLRAVDIGVNTLEMDVVISKDHKVVLSHEPFLSHEICKGPEGEEITEENEREFNLYQMEYSQISKCDCGTKLHKRFPEQEKMRVHKPLLAEVIDAAESKVAAENKPALFYNIETKSQARSDNVFHPEPEQFVDLLMEVLQEKGIENRCIIQSFDIRTLQVAHRKYPDMTLALLIENERSPEENLEELGFVPEIYSPYFERVDKALLELCKEKEMKVIPWTLNEKEDIARMVKLGVDGIISDYPNRVVEVRQETM